MTRPRTPAPHAAEARTGCDRDVQAAPLRLQVVTGEPPAALEVMRAEAKHEGHRVLERLAADWASGAVRFDRGAEALLVACLGDAPAGVGGLTLDPVLPGVLRMRRFYVRPISRRRGVGRALALALLDRPERGDREVVVNAGTAGAAAFWEAIGFTPDLRRGHTHVLRRSRP